MLTLAIKPEKVSAPVGTARREMIIREWRGRASSSKANAYPEHFRTKVLPELFHTTGFLGAHLGRRRVDDGVIEFLVLTRWRSMDAVRGFAGSDVAKAVVEPGAVAALVDFDASVQHYEVLEDVQSAAP
jgi:heme-degrading monooxygenase HmoA